MSERVFVKIRVGWHEEGKTGVILWPLLSIKPYLSAGGGMRWSPVLFDNEEDPTFCKSDGLEVIIPKKSVAKRLLQRLEESL